MIEIVVLAVIALAALGVAYAIVRHTNAAASDMQESYLLHVEKLENWIDGERNEQRLRVKDAREDFDKTKATLYGTIEALRRRATDAENTVLNQNAQIHALLTERAMSVPQEPAPPQPTNGVHRVRSVREPILEAIPNDNAEGYGDGGSG